jgi:MFS family permease
MTSRWSILALLFLVRTCMGIQFQSVPAISPLFLQDFAVSVADIGLLIGLYHAPGVALAVPGGGLGRRFGDTLVVSAGLGLMLVGTLIMALMPGWGSQISGRLIAGIGAVLLNVLMSKMVTDWFTGREIATAMGIFVNSWPFGIAIGLVLFPVIAVHGGVQAVNVTVLCFIAVALTALVALFRPPPNSAPATATPQLAGGWPVGTALSAVLVAGLIWGFYNAALGVVFGFGTLMLTERNWSMEGASLATSFVLWSMVPCLPLGGVIADRLGRHVTMIIASCTAFALLLLAATRFDMTFPIFVLIGILGGLAAGPIMSLPSRVLGAETRAVGMGLFFTMFYLLQAAGPWLAGRASAYRGQATGAFETGVAYLLVAIALTRVFVALSARSQVSVPADRATRS